MRIIVEDLKDACPKEKKHINPDPIDMKIDSPNEEKDDTLVDPTDPVFCPVPFCTPELAKTGYCDFKLFVSWIGSDKNHKKLISSSERFMIFHNYNLEKLFESVLEIIEPKNEPKKEEVNTQGSKNSYIIMKESVEDEVYKRMTTLKEVKLKAKKTSIKEI